MLVKFWKNFILQMITCNFKSLEEVHYDSVKGQFTFPGIQWICGSAPRGSILHGLLTECSPPHPLERDRSDLSRSGAWGVPACSLKSTCCLFLPFVYFLRSELVICMLFEDIAVNERQNPCFQGAYSLVQETENKVG